MPDLILTLEEDSMTTPSEDVCQMKSDDESESDNDPIAFEWQGDLFDFYRD